MITIDCPRCDGTGSYYEEDVVLGEYVEEIVDCEDCYYSGKISVTLLEYVKFKLPVWKQRLTHFVEDNYRRFIKRKKIVDDELPF